MSEITRVSLDVGLSSYHKPGGRWNQTGWREVLTGPGGTFTAEGDFTGHTERVVLTDGSVHETEVAGEGADYQLLSLIREAHSPP